VECTALNHDMRTGPVVTHTVPPITSHVDLGLDATRQFGSLAGTFTEVHIRANRSTGGLPSQMKVVFQKRHRQRGNAILEGALIFLPMMALLLGIVDVSLAVYIQSTLTSATREGARFAITYGSSYNGNSCASSQASCIAEVVQNNAIGLPAGLNTSYITVNYYTTNDLTHPVEACNSGNCTTSVCTVSTCTLPQTLSNGTVVSYANQPGNVVEVVVAGYPWNWLVPMPGYQAGTGVTLSAASIDVLGGLAVGTTVPPSP
jgi:Flp pilus assembly protein TadG